MATKLSTRTKRQSYTVSDKLRIVNFAEQQEIAQLNENLESPKQHLIVAKEQGELGEDASTKACKSWQESCMARTQDQPTRMDHGETEQWSCHSTFSGALESP